ncbi:MAG: hypothetical protein C4583_09190 [Anaerolineaceae bacterium]|nr:MAG: hypothetical protein C4583_09190 [Anaerolineaceae bacterium]
MKKRYCYKCKREVEPIILQSASGKECCPSCANPFDLSESLNESFIQEVKLSERALKDSFEALGLSEDAAKVAAKGREIGDDLVDSFEALGLSEDAAKIAAKGREIGDDLVDSFEALGLSEDAAKVAAKGRG